MAFSDDSDDDTPQGKRAAHTARLEALRLFVEDIATVVNKLDAPDTYLEAERGARCLFINDRALQDVPQIAGETLREDAKTLTQPLRRDIRRSADRLMEAAALIPKPTCYLEGERAGRYALAYKRLLSQLYEEPKPNTKTPKLPEFADDEDDIPEADIDYRQMLTDKLNHVFAARAQAFGFWGTGEPFDPAYPRAGCTDGERPPAKPKRLRIDDGTLADMTAVSAPAVAKIVTGADTPEHPLDRPVWSALTSSLSPLVTAAGDALRLKPEYGDMAAAARYTPETLSALSRGETVQLIEPPEIAAKVAAHIPENRITERRQWRQMILDQLPPIDISREQRFPVRTYRPLGASDRNEMQYLAEKSGLPPLAPDVHVFSDWLGIRVDEKLVCMLGTRLFLPGYTELIGPCTHPDYRCDGMADKVLRLAAHTIRDRGDTPFLHVDVDDAAARAYCHRMGFIDRKTLEVMVLGKAPSPLLRGEVWDEGVITDDSLPPLENGASPFPSSPCNRGRSIMTRL